MERVPYGTVNGLTNLFLKIKNKKTGSKKYSLYHICHLLLEMMEMCLTGQLLILMALSTEEDTGWQAVGTAHDHPVAHVSPLFGTSASPGREGTEPQSPENNVKGEGSKDPRAGHWALT